MQIHRRAGKAKSNAQEQKESLVPGSSNVGFDAYFETSLKPHVQDCQLLTEADEKSLSREGESVAPMFDASDFQTQVMFIFLYALLDYMHSNT